MRNTDLQLGRGGVGCVLNKHLKVKVKSNLLPHCHWNLCSFCLKHIFFMHPWIILSHPRVIKYSSCPFWAGLCLPLFLHSCVRVSLGSARSGPSCSHSAHMTAMTQTTMNHWYQEQLISVRSIWGDNRTEKNIIALKRSSQTSFPILSTPLDN